MKLLTSYLIAIILIVLNVVQKCESFSLYMMGTRRRMNKKVTKKTSTSPKSLNQGKGQEITGVTLPTEGSVKGWEFGNKQRIACAQVDGKYYGIQADCPRCAFDLYKGTIITDEAAFGPDIPKIACPTCSATYSFNTGKHGPIYKNPGFLNGFVGDLARKATTQDSVKDAKAFIVTKDDETDRVFLRER